MTFSRPNGCRFFMKAGPHFRTKNKYIVSMPSTCKGFLIMGQSTTRGSATMSKHVLICSNHFIASGRTHFRARIRTTAIIVQIEVYFSQLGDHVCHLEPICVTSLSIIFRIEARSHELTITRLIFTVAVSRSFYRRNGTVLRRGKSMERGLPIERVLTTQRTISQRNGEDQKPPKSSIQLNTELFGIAF